MTKKHFEMMAKLFRDQIEENKSYGNSAGAEAIINLAERFCFEAEYDNPRFDRDRFLTACGIEIA